jgi:hypothetical protein
MTIARINMENPGTLVFIDWFTCECESWEMIYDYQLVLCLTGDKALARHLINDKLFGQFMDADGEKEFVNVYLIPDDDTSEVTRKTLQTLISERTSLKEYRTLERENLEKAFEPYKLPFVVPCF